MSTMATYLTLLLGILPFIQFTYGGLLHGVGYSAVSAPINYNYGTRLASLASPQIIANPVAASYSARYTAYAAVPLTTSVATPSLVPRQPVGGLVRAFAVPSFSRHLKFSNSLFKQGVSAYAAVPIAGYRASFGAPSIRSHVTPSLPSFRSFPVELNVQGLYPPAAGFDDSQSDSLLVNDHQRTFGNFEAEHQLSVW